MMPYNFWYCIVSWIGFVCTLFELGDIANHNIFAALLLHLTAAYP